MLILGVLYLENNYETGHCSLIKHSPCSYIVFIFAVRTVEVEQDIVEVSSAGTADDSSPAPSPDKHRDAGNVCRWWRCEVVFVLYGRRLYFLGMAYQK